MMGKAETTRQYIIEQSAPIFNKNGYSGTSMSLLTKAINMTKGAIYGNFKDKDEIAIEAFDHNFGQIAKKVRAVVVPEKTAPDKLIAYAKFYPDHYPDLVTGGGCPVLNAAVDAENVHSGLKERVAKAIDMWLTSVTKIVYSGIRRDQIHKGVRPEQFATVFVSLIEGGIMLANATGDPGHLRRNVDHIVYMVNTELRT